MAHKLLRSTILLLASTVGVFVGAGLAGAQSSSFSHSDAGTAGSSHFSAKSEKTWNSAASRADSAQPVDEFTLGIGDVIRVSVWHEPELTATVIIRPDGKISLPLAGEVPVASKTPVSSEDLIRKLLLTYVTDPQVTVSVVEIHSRQVFITGQVQHPGSYPLLGTCSVLQLIASAGGLTPYARKKRIIILDSNNRPLGRFNYSSAVNGDLRQGKTLEPGDTVVVP